MYLKISNKKKQIEHIYLLPRAIGIQKHEKQKQL